MVHFYDTLSDSLRDWALSQPLFFTASAPLAGRHINVSPKGLPSRTLAFFDGRTVAYVDHSGSGAETISHLYENGRCTLMFCSFDSAPQIMRLFCTGYPIEADRPEFHEWLARMGKEEFAGARAVIVLDIFKVQTSCGFAVPLMDGRADAESETAFHDRDTLDRWSEKQIEKGRMEAHRAQYNARSLDGLGGMKVARRANGEGLWLGDTKIWFQRISGQREALLTGFVMGIVLLLTIFLIATHRDRIASEMRESALLGWVVRMADMNLKALR